MTSTDAPESADPAVSRTSEIEPASLTTDPHATPKGETPVSSSDRVGSADQETPPPSLPAINVTTPDQPAIRSGDGTSTTEEPPSSSAPQPTPSPDSSAQRPTSEKADNGESPSGPSSSSPADPSTGSKEATVEAPAPPLELALLVNTGGRYEFTVDAKYLSTRPVNVPNNDPYQMSVYTLKELIWRDWRDDWESRPSSPSSIRLIFFGKMLEDKSSLAEVKLEAGRPNVVHMTVKPQDIVDEEDAKNSKHPLGRDGASEERSPRCRCVVM